MALSDIRKFNFYQKYVWNPTDFENFETWLFGAMEGVFEGAFGAAVLSGLKALPNTGMALTVDAGIAVSGAGRIIVVPASFQATLATPAGNPARSLVVLRPKSTDATDIPQPTNPGVMVPLHEKLEYVVVVLNGTPAASPAYPATQAGDVIVIGVKLAAGQTTITRANLDLSMVDRPRKRLKKINVITSSVTVDSHDQVIEADFSAASGVVQLPPAGDYEGQEFSVVKIDSTSNIVAVSGNGAEAISGQNVVELDTQWQAITVYSNGLSWRSI